MHLMKFKMWMPFGLNDLQNALMVERFENFCHLYRLDLKLGPSSVLLEILDGSAKVQSFVEFYLHRRVPFQSRESPSNAFPLQFIIL